MSIDVSVVIPVYNRERLIARALRSVLAQTFRSFEVVVADDASTDDTEAVVLGFGDERIRYVRRATNGGNAAARNLGVAHARGRYVSFLDSDDEYRPDFLSRTVAALDASGPEVGFCWTGVTRVFDAGPSAGRSEDRVWNPTQPENAYLFLLRSSRVGTDHGLSVKAACFRDVGSFDERLRTAVDTDFLLRLAREYRFTVVPEPLVILHDHDEARVRRDTRAKAEAYDLIIPKHEAALSRHRELWARFHYKAGWLHYHAGNKRQAREALRRVLRRSPLHAKSWAALCLFEVLGRFGSRVHGHVSAARSRA
jgi:glycosyltransferase involved in cell wall biosynthesis